MQADKDDTGTVPTGSFPHHTFPVSPVERATESCSEVTYEQALNALLNQGSVPLEAYARETKRLIDPGVYGGSGLTHAFIASVNLAYDRHYPLVLSPDMIWLLIAQGFALHVSANAETLRERLVTHPDRADISVRRDGFLRGFAGNDWEGVFAELSHQIKAYVRGEVYHLLVPRFSTTGIVEKAAFEITLLDALQHYFDYGLVTACGIPEITLEGTPEDWDSLRARAEQLGQYDLAWWLEFLLPVLDQFARASRGEVDTPFWENLYKLDRSSGGPFIQGHVVSLFPYLTTPPLAPQSWERCPSTAPVFDDWQKNRNSLYRNPYLGRKAPGPEWATAIASTRTVEELIELLQANPEAREGMTSHMLPSALSVAPFTWEYRGTKLSMEFVAGFIGVAQNADTLALRPEIGWAVRERPETS